MATVMDAVVAGLRRLPGGVEGTATGGSTTTLADTTRLTAYDDDAWIRGWLYLLSGSLANTVLAVTDSAAAGGTVTFATQTAAVASGNRYILAPAIWDAERLRWAVAEALRLLPAVEVVDETLTGDGATQEFTLSALAAGEVRQVFVIPDEVEAAPVEVLWWEQRASGTLWLAVPPDDGATVRVVYVDEPADLVDVTSWTATLPAAVRLEFIAWYVAFAAHRGQIGRPGLDNAQETELMNFALQMANQELAKCKVTKPRQRSMPTDTGIVKSEVDRVVLRR